MAFIWKKTRSITYFYTSLQHSVAYFSSGCSFLNLVQLRNVSRYPLIDCARRMHQDIQQPFLQCSPFPSLDIPENISLPHHIMNEFSNYGHLTALVDGATGQEITYPQLQTSVAKVGSAFVKMGLRFGDVVTMYSHNCPEFAIVALAVGSIGAILSAVNPAYTVDELKNALLHNNTLFLVVTQSMLHVARQAVQQCPHVKEIIVFGHGDGCRPFSNLLEDDMSEFPDNIDFSPKSDIMALPFSSGTTGLPKGVMLSHYNLVSNVIQIRSPIAMNYQTGFDCLLAVLPLFHIYGQVVLMYAGLASGAKIVTLPGFQPLPYLEAIQKYKVTFLHVAPPLVLFFAQFPLIGNYDLSSTHSMFTGAAPCSPNVMEMVVEKFQGRISLRQGYGLTETSPLTHLNQTDGNKYHTIGRAVNDTEFKIIDTETGEPLGAGKTGELCIRGPQVMLGYFKNKTATDETIVNGWLHTGDVGHYDEDGHVIIEDRIKELIKVKGLQVAPAELESILVSHPSVKDAAVVGIKDEQLGEAPKAFVVLRPNTNCSEEELKKYVEERVSPFKKLAGGVEFRTEIPRSASGKILRRILKEEMRHL